MAEQNDGKASTGVNRRQFLGAVGALSAAALATGIPRKAYAQAPPPPQQSYFLNSWGVVQPCAADTIAAGIVPPPLPAWAQQQVPTQPQGNTSRRRFPFGSRKKPQEYDGPAKDHLGCINSGCANQNPTAPATHFPLFNILLIMCDQMRAPRWYPGNGGSAAIQAVLPNLTMLQNQSYVFNQYFVSATNCTPSRATMQTGLYGPQTNMFVTDDPPSSGPFPPALQPYVQTVNNVPTPGQGFATIGDVLSTSAGLAGSNYDCLWIGKWHLSDNPTESGSQYSCEPGSNGPSDYGYVNPTKTPPSCDACIPTPPSSGYPPAVPFPYTSPNGKSNQGNSGDFLGLGQTSQPAPGADIPAYTCPPQPSCPDYPEAPSYPSFIQLNDSAVTSAFLTWLGSLPTTGNPPPPKWFCGVSFVNPHDMTQFPYSFDLTSAPVMPGTTCGSSPQFCPPTDDTGTPADPTAAVGYPTPPSSTTQQTYNGPDYPSDSESVTIPPFPAYPLGSGNPLYSTANGVMDMWLGVTHYDTPWNYGDSPADPSNAKPDLQLAYQTESKALYGYPNPNYTGGTEAGWLTFLNYYIWMQACLDYQIGQVLGTNPNSTNGLKQSSFWGHTVIIFTADHGDLRRVPRPAVQGRGSLRRGHERAPVHQLSGASEQHVDLSNLVYASQLRLL